MCALITSLLACTHPGDSKSVELSGNANEPAAGWFSADRGQSLLVRNILSGATFLILAAVIWHYRKKLNDKRNEQKYLRQQLESQNDLFRLLTENTTEGIWDFNVRQGVGIFSRRWYPMFGYEPKEKAVSLSDWMKLIHPDDRPLSQKAFSDFIESGGQGQYEYEMRIKRADGAWCWILSRGRTITRDSDGKPLRIIGLHLDIQKAKETQEKIQRSEENFIKLFKYSPVPMAIFSEDGAAVDINIRFTSVLGYTFDDLQHIENWWARLKAQPTVQKNDMGTWQEVLKMAGASKSSMSRLEFQLNCKNGENRTMMVEGTDIDGNILVSFYDMTDYREAEKEREKLREQLLQAQKLEAVGLLAGGIAHDFNNMLGAIMGYSELILTELEPDSPHRTSIETILDAAMRSADLTRGLLAFARKQTVAPVPLDVNQTVESVLNILGRLIGENISLNWHPGRNPGTIKIDPSQVDQILTNLCVNARDAIAGVGSITIETDTVTFDQDFCDNHADFKPGHFVLLAVSDNGSGMSDETIAHIFEPFFTTKKQGQGTGMGLATVYGITKQNNGFINVYSEPGMGTTFRIYLPVCDEAAVPKFGTVNNDSEGKGETILLVEDDTILLEMTTTMLNRLGYKVIPANTPGEALHAVQNLLSNIDLIITDVVMPEMNGKELAARIQSTLPVDKLLYMSGYTANIIEQQCLLDAGTQFIEKPFSEKELAVKVRNLLD
ncbi:MAG: PAS domain-containing protein [Deltaproteobacteria bacterium]|nr:PAS domain-containing protein [Deltaproteobacteria bacterium]